MEIILLKLDNYKNVFIKLNFIKKILIEYYKTYLNFNNLNN